MRESKKLRIFFYSKHAFSAASLLSESGTAEYVRCYGRLALSFGRCVCYAAEHVFPPYWCPHSKSVWKFYVTLGGSMLPSPATCKWPRPVYFT